MGSTDTLRGKCPNCSATISVPLMRFATEIRVRTCRACGSRWQIKATPLPTKTPGLQLHELTFTAI